MLLCYGVLRGCVLRERCFRGSLGRGVGKWGQGGGAAGLRGHRWQQGQRCSGIGWPGPVATGVPMVGLENVGRP